MRADVRFIFESLTGMQELWNGEDQIIKFYSHSCPRLYELNTVAYWIIEKQAHSPRLRAHINQIAQVAVDLSVKRGKTYLTPIKAEARNLEILNRPHCYWTKGTEMAFEGQTPQPGQLDLGSRLKDLRLRRGISQTQLAKRVGVTPSSISQVESNLIYPSLPALLKIAEVIGVPLSTVFSGAADRSSRIVFPAAKTQAIQWQHLGKDAVDVRQFVCDGIQGQAEAYVMEMAPGKKLAGHFFVHKGQEIGYLLQGRLQIKTSHAVHTAEAGDLIYLTSEIPVHWENTATETARLLWIKIC
jgi:transcriptional regulator with XRE-family HTH domain